MTRRRTYLFLCRLLAPRGLSRRRDRSVTARVASGGVNWERVIEVSSRHMVTPAVLTALEKRGLGDHVPGEVREFLAGLRDLSAQRNAQLRSQVIACARALNEAGLTPVLLKGAAYQFEGLQAHPGDRVPGDLDLLIPAEAAREAYLALVKIGYQGYFQTDEDDPYHDHHHLPPLEHLAHPAVVELHLEPFNKAFGAVLTGAEVSAGATMTEIEGARLGWPSITHQVMINIVHQRIKRKQQFRKALWFPLRHLHDLSLICRSGEVDWDLVRRRFMGADRGSLLRVYLSLARRFMGLKRPGPGYGLRPLDRLGRAVLLGVSLRR